MAGAATSLTVRGFDSVERMIARLMNPDFTQLLDEIGAEVVSQTQDRVRDDKESPDGDAWPLLNPAYASRKKGSGGLLEGVSNPGLLSSLTHVVHGNEVEIGSGLIYAATHQFGDESRGIPQREFLGLSDEGADQVEMRCEEFIGRLLGEKG